MKKSPWVAVKFNQGDESKISVQKIN